MTTSIPPEASFRVRRSGTLLDGLERMFVGRSRRDLRRLLNEGRVRVNGLAATSFSQTVREGDLIECARFGLARKLHPKVLLVHEDDDLLVVEKGVDILTEGGTPHGPRTVADVLTRYLHAHGRRGRAHACHRLDREVSGLLAFAKRAELARGVRSDPRRFLSERVYSALVEGVPRPPEATIRSFLADGDDQVVRVAAPEEGGKLAIAHYRVVASGDDVALLEVRLESGRKNQIRVQLSEIGHPIAGDRKYGARTDPLGRLALHARRLAITNPRSGARLELETEPPFTLGARSPRASRS